jgi:hypothetical protein
MTLFTLCLLIYPLRLPAGSRLRVVRVRSGELIDKPPGLALRAASGALSRSARSMIYDPSGMVPVMVAVTVVVPVIGSLVDAEKATVVAPSVTPSAWEACRSVDHWQNALRSSTGVAFCGWVSTKAPPVAHEMLASVKVPEASLPCRVSMSGRWQGQHQNQTSR